MALITKITLDSTTHATWGVFQPQAEDEMLKEIANIANQAIKDYGQKVKEGDWQGDRVLPRGWSEFVSTPAPTSQDQGYGGLFWLNRGGRYDRIPLDAYWASGFMGQRTTIIPSRDMVVVRLGPSPAGFDGYFNELLGRILDAVAVDSGR